MPISRWKLNCQTTLIESSYPCGRGISILNNLDQLLKLVPKNNNCIYRNNVIEVRSLRVDTGLYEELKHRAESKNKTISELLNIALEQYFNNNN